MRVIEFHGPGDEPFVHLIRLASVSFASHAGLAIDTCDELRLAVDEACSALVAVGPESLDVTFTEDDTTLTISVRTSEPGSVHLNAEATLVLKTMTDDFSVAFDGAVILKKRLS